MILVDTPKEGAYALDNRLKEVLSKQTFINKSVKINLISAVATYPEDGFTADELMKKARGLTIVNSQSKRGAKWIRKKS